MRLSSVKGQVYSRMPDDFALLAVSVSNRCVGGEVNPRAVRSRLHKQAAVAVQDPVQSAWLGIEPGVEHVTSLSHRAGALALTCVTTSERAVKYMVVLIC